ncbi:MAG TPA: UDP-4-amino-4,6-dideoxy-N-acetyl-beta-L-altrosamine transaminase [Verrucomicrobiales bacterium]|nr:UDP-4-amino-4,6-dideoxy-N-acetyl-beta-L-altrosamine transaminase [Verrucomicrobiales bacterium]
MTVSDSFIPYGRQDITAGDIEAVTETLQSGFLTSGPRVEEFEAAFARCVGSKYAVAVCNATAALHLAMRVTDIGPGDRVVTSPNTFLASANCASFVGATPDFSDIDPKSYNLCADTLEANWQDDTKAVVAVAYAGQAPNMPRIGELCRSKGALVIEDACHGTGGGFHHEGAPYKLGGHPWADITTFSFHPVKALTMGEGGILVTDNESYATQARHLRSHGVTRAPREFRGIGSESPAEMERGTWYYEMSELGYNYRVTDIQCALGLSQLGRIGQYAQRRRDIVAAYNEAFAGIPHLKTPVVTRPEDIDQICWHLYTTLIDFEELGLTRTAYMAKLREAGVGSQVLYIPVHLQPYYRETFGYGAGKCPNAESYYRHALSFPLFPSMTDSDVGRVIEAVTTLHP